MKKNNRLFRLACLAAIYNLQLLCAPGNIDTTFGTDGIVVTNLSRTDFINSCTVQPDDKIVVAGAANGYFQRIGVARYTEDGAPDTGFNTTGFNIILIGTQSIAQAVTLQDDEKILLAGYASEGATNFAVARLTTGGSFDTSFNTTGRVVTPIGDGSTGNSILVQPDSKILVGGLSVSGQGVFALARYDSAGALDTSFNGSGTVTTTLGYLAIINQIALQADGKIVAGGYVWSGANTFCIVRYNTDGTIDTSFGTDGVVTTAVGSDSEINSIVIQDDQYIIAAGYSLDDVDNVTKFALARYDTDGNLDASFGTGGIVKTNVQYESKANSVILQADGKIIVGGYSYADLATQFALARYNTDGSLDTSFGTNGITLTTIGGHNSDSAITSLSLQSSGDIIAAGHSESAFAIARYLAA